MSDCLPPRLDADMLSITETSSEEGDDALYFLGDFFPCNLIIGGPISNVTP